MIARTGSALSTLFARTAPDPFVIAIALTLLAALLTLTMGDYPGAQSLPDKATAMIDAWRGADGLWMFLAFGMQMSLILVTGHALAASRPIRALLEKLASLPTSAPAAAALVGFVAAVFGLINWGLGLIVGALVVVGKVARDAADAQKALFSPEQQREYRQMQIALRDAGMSY
ncbi:MAG: TIGR00366 family protein, partial [Phycisphaerales bacterium]